MHPLKAAIEMLHQHASRMHEAAQTTDFDDKHKVAEMVLGLMPEIVEAMQGVMAAVIAFFATR